MSLPEEQSILESLSLVSVSLQAPWGVGGELLLGSWVTFEQVGVSAAPASCAFGVLRIGGAHRSC